MILCKNINELRAIVNEWKAANLRVVFTNGVFDILHVGHVDYIQKAKDLGDRLIVAINDDASVKKLNKGPERPINPQQARAQVVAALRAVDAVLIFEQDTPLQLIQAILPDVLVKGGDYDPTMKDPKDKTFIVGSAEVIENGGRVITIPLVNGFSSTAILKKIR